MEKKTKELLSCKVQAEIESLNTMEAGSEERSKVVSDIATLYKLKLEEDTKASEIEERAHKMSLEIEEQKQNKFFQWLKFGVEVGAVVLPLTFYAFWMARGFKFEEEGTITSSTFRGLIGKFKPTK